MKQHYINISPFYSILKSQIIGVTLEETPIENSSGESQTYSIKILIPAGEIVFRTTNNLEGARQVFSLLRRDIVDDKTSEERHVELLCMHEDICKKMDQYREMKIMENINEIR